MPALVKTAAALALALGLVAGGGAQIQGSSQAVERHTSYVALIEWMDAPDETPVITGTVGCEVTILQDLVARFTGREPCTYEQYAYAYPPDATAPWDVEPLWVNDSYYADETGSIWHVAEVVYRDLRRASPDGETMVHAIASELLPSQASLGGLDVNYALPVDPGVLHASQEQLIVGIGPAPGPA